MNFFGRAVLIASLILFMLASFEKQEKNRSESAKQGLVSTSSFVHLNAVLEEAVNLPFFHKNWSLQLCRLNFMHFSQNSKFWVDNIKSSLVIFSLEKYEQLIKPINIRKFYHYLFQTSSEELPALS